MTEQTPALPRHSDVPTWRPATAADVDALTVLTQAADRVDHPSWLTPREDIEEVFASSWIDPTRDTIVGMDAAGNVVAYGSAVLHPSRDVHVHAYLDGRVHPDVRGRGIGRELLRWQHERALQALAEEAATVPEAIFVYAEETNAAARRLAERRGLREERWFTTMVRDLAQEIPEVPLREGAASTVQIVTYAPEWSEVTRLARNDAFRDHWGSLETPPERWAHFVEGPFLRHDLSWLAVDGNRVVALALGSVNEEDWVAQGYSSVYIDLIGVTRDHRGRGLAPAVITALLTAARDAGLEKAVLDVDTESPTGANSLYGGLGFEATERSVALVARR